MNTITLNSVTVDVETARAAVAAFDEAAKRPKFAVGDWVVDTVYGWGTGRVTKPWDNYLGLKIRVASDKFGSGLFDPGALRHATPDEIAAATRITPKMGMLLEDEDGYVYRVVHVSEYCTLRGLVVALSRSLPTKDVSAQRFTIRDRVTIEGVR